MLVLSKTTSTGSVATTYFELFGYSFACRRPAAIRDVTMSREEIEAKRSEFGTYCPVRSDAFSVQ